MRLLCASNDGRSTVAARAPGSHIRSLIAFLVGLLSLGLVWLVQNLKFISWDLRNNLWGPSYLLLHRSSPYRLDMLFDHSGAVWFPAAIGLFFPLGALPENQAASLWLVFNLFLLVILIWLALDPGMPSPPKLGFAVGFVFLFPPVLSHLILGQFTILIVVLLLLAARLLSKSSVLPLGFLLAVSLAKPQLALLALPGILLAQGVQHGARSGLRLLVWLSIFSVLLTIPLWIAYPSWYTDFLIAQQSKPDWLQPTLPIVLQINFGFSAIQVWAVLASVVFIANAALWLRLPPERAMLWSLCLTPVASPYIWSWDFVLVLPLLLNTFSRLRSKVAAAALAAGSVLCTASIGWVRLTTDNSDHLYWWVPFSVLLVISIAKVIESLASGYLFKLHSPETRWRGGASANTPHFPSRQRMTHAHNFENQT